MTIRFTALAGALVAVSVWSPALADWSTDPAQNTPVVTVAGDQVLPKTAAIPGGGSYVGWFSSEGGNYNVRLQRLDAAGNPQWGADGLLVSDQPSMSFIVDWDLTADAQGNAAVVFSDVRDGGDLDVHTYRIDPAGVFLWGPTGVTVSSNSDFEPAPRITQASNGDFVIVWARLPDVGEGKIMMQRLTPAGVPLLAAGGVPVAGDPGEEPAFCSIVPSTDGDVIVSWVRDTASFLSSRHIRAQKFDAAAQPQWNATHVVVYDAGVVPIAYDPVLQPDGAGGAIVAWHRFAGGANNCLVQRFDTDGNELFPADGALVSTSTAQNRYAPSVSFDAATGNTLVFWDERNLGQSAWGVYGQKLSPKGSRLWGETGKVLVPVNGDYKGFVRSIPQSDGGATVLWFRAPFLGSPSALIDAMRVDAAGDPVWAPAIASVCTVASSKDDPEILAAGGGAAVLAWHDQRNDGGDIYAQRLNADGTLGGAACAGDFNGDGSLSVADFADFRTAYLAGDMSADYSGNGSLDVADFSTFRTAYLAGCP